MAGSTRRSIIEVYRDQTRSRQQVLVNSNKTTTLRVMRGRPVTIVELDAASAFRPGGAVLLPGDPAGEASPIPALAAALLHARDKDDRLLVAAHGADEALATRRARSVLLFLRGDRAGWAEAAQRDGRVEDWQQALAWVASARGWPCDPGAADGAVGPKTRQALAEFRARWSEASGEPAPQGELSLADWRALFGAFDAVLAAVLQEPEADLTARRAALPVVERAAVGCGGAWPPDRVRIGDHAAAQAERVDLLFFAAVDVPVLECHQQDPCDWKRCDLYRKQKYVAVQPELGAATVRVRLTGMLFETDKTFLLPRSLRAIKALKRIYDKRLPAEVLVVGHTDTMGTKVHNRKLSEGRARAIEAYLRDRVEDWLAWYGADKGGQAWGVREDKHMLSHLRAAKDGPPFYEGPIDAAATKAYSDALRRFQAWSNEARGTTLKVDGLSQGKGETRRELIACYMGEDGTTLPPECRTLVHGCGEHHPVVATKDEVEEQENRRVEVYLFAQAVNPPPRDACPEPEGCAEYPLWVGQSVETIDLRDDLASLEVVVREPGGTPVAAAQVKLDGPGADQGETGAEGKRLFEDQLPGTYQVTVTKKGYEPVTVDAEAPGLVEVVLVRLAPAVARVIPGTVFLGPTACPGPGALEHVAWLQLHADLTEDRKLRVFAHTRQGGGDAADKALSDRRARATIAMLTRDVALFDQVAAEEEWPLRAYQAMLRGVGCDPGPLDGKPGKKTELAVRGFQRDYNLDAFHRDAGQPRAHGDLPVDGVLSPATQAALREAYLVFALSAAPLPKDAFVAPGFSGCAGFNPLPGDDDAGRVEVAVFTEKVPEAFPCAAGDAGACQLEGDEPQRCRFYREVLVHDDSQAREPFFDLKWLREPDGSVFLSALTPLREGTPVTFTVHRCEAPLPARPLASSRSPERPALGPVLGAATGKVEGGIASARWTPPAGVDPFDWLAWVVDQEQRPDAQPLEPPLFVVEAGEHWAVSRPPGHRLDRLRLDRKEQVGGLAILNDGRLLTFQTVDGLIAEHGDEVVAVHLDGFRVDGVVKP